MKLSLVARKMLLFIALATGALVAGGVILCVAVPAIPIIETLYVSLGIVFSSLINAVKVILLERQVAKLGAMEDPTKGKAYASGQAVLRFLLTGGGLVAAHFIPFTNLYAAIVGAFTWHIAAFALKYAKIDED